MNMNGSTLTHRANNFDFVRIVAAASVLFSHQFALSGLPEPLVLKYQTLGGYAVMVFFSISGYLIANSWDREPLLAPYIWKRLLRIWPGLICTTLICGLILGPLVTTVPLGEYFTSEVTAKYFATLLFHVSPFLPGVFPHSPVAYVPNGVLWTIPIELRCYLYLAVLGLLGVLKNKRVLLIVLAVMAVWYYGIHNAEAVFDKTHSHLFEVEYATFFFSGTALYYFRNAWAGLANKLTLAAIACLVGVAAYALGHELLCAFLVTPTLVVLFGASRIPVLCRFGRFGDLSYGTYIYAFPVQQLVIQSFPKMSYWQHLAIVIPVVFLLAWLSWHLVEKVALRYKAIPLPFAGKRRSQCESSQAGNMAKPSDGPRSF